MDYVEIGSLIDAHRAQILTKVAQAHLEDPYLVERFGADIEKKIAIDTRQNLAALGKAIRYHSPMILDDYLVWRRQTMVNMNGSTGLVRKNFTLIWSVASDYLAPDALTVIHNYIQSALHALQYARTSTKYLTAAQNQLTEALVATTYDNHWIWQNAYHAHGRVRALREIWWYLDYLNDALGMNNPEVLGRQLRWMRERAVERGLATIHIQQLLWFLAEIAERHLPPEPVGDMQRMLRNCLNFLAYDNSSCVVLIASQDRIVADAAQQFVVQGLAPRLEHAAIEVGSYLAYLYDCLAKTSAASLIRYTNWLRPRLAQLGRSDATLAQSYAMIEQALQAHLPEPIAQEASALLQAALQQLSNHRNGAAYSESELVVTQF
ncbi:MAG: hypothetical protein MI924_12430 [Chloroflexales bacterium]|nr:hypothetical protein [Chloroflexales bacterium]